MILKENIRSFRVIVSMQKYDAIWKRYLLLKIG